MGGRGQKNPRGGGVGGSGLHHTSDLDHSEGLQKMLDKEEARTLYLKREQMTVYDKNDTAVIHKQGGKGSVSYSTREAQDYFYGATITHNHPSGDERGGISGTFSVADVETFRFGLKEMRASGAEGTYVLRNRNYNNRDSNRAYEFYRAYADFQSQQNFGSINTVKAAQEKARKTSIGRRYTNGINKATSLFKSGNWDAAQKLYNSTVSSYESGFKKQIKRFIYEDMNSTTSGWLKQNASKYGFDYILTDTKGRKSK